MMSRQLTLLLVMLACLAGSATAQQLLILKKGKVLSRFNEGDEIRFELKDQKQIHHSVLQTIREFYFVTEYNDTIQYTRVARIKFVNDSRKKYGLTTALIGVGFLTVYGLNAIFFDEYSQSMRGLRLVGILSVGFGMLFYFTGESSIKLNGIKRLKYVSYDSPLFR